MCIILKMAGHRAKRSEIWDWGMLVTRSLHDHFGSFGACLNMACISKTAGFGAKRSGIWDSGILVAHIWGIFDLVGFKVT